jgi:hypothetical protein
MFRDFQTKSLFDVMQEQQKTPEKKGGRGVSKSPSKNKL